MERLLSVLLILCLMLTLTPFSYAEQPHQNAVYELYSADGYYEDGVGNKESYSYHVPQINAETPAANEINAEIAERFGSEVESQFTYMEKGTSLWLWKTTWQAFWSGSQLFLLITTEENGDIVIYGVYGYDFETGIRITNEMILEQKGISEEDYLENLRETVLLMFEERYGDMTSDPQKNVVYQDMLEKTLGRLDGDQPIFINQFGEIETIVEINSVAGAGWYYYLITPFSNRDSGDRAYRINVVGDTDLVEFCPESAKEGETVTIRTYDVTDGDKKISVSGADGTSVNWFEYQFVMPDHDVDVHVEFIDYGLV